MSMYFGNRRKYARYLISTLDEVIAELAPWVTKDNRCAECGGKYVETSPTWLKHSPDCKSNNLYYRVVNKLVSGQIRRKH